MNLERLQHQITTLNHRKIQASGNNSTYLPPAVPKKWNKELVSSANIFANRCKKCASTTIIERKTF